MEHPSVEDILAPEFLTGLGECGLGEIRRRRDGATEVETGLSYLRRLAQGRLDIVLAERSRRSAGLPAGDVAGLVDRLPEILGDHVHAPGMGRLPTILAPGDIDDAFAGRLEAIVPTSALGDLAALPDDRLATVAEALEAFEREISSQRRLLHGVLDHLQEEIVRRYKTGEATVDTLLQ